MTTSITTKTRSVHNSIRIQRQALCVSQTFEPVLASVVLLPIHAPSHDADARQVQRLPGGLFVAPDTKHKDARKKLHKIDEQSRDARRTKIHF